MNNAFRRLHDALSVPKLPRPQSIESLFAMGAPPAQIAKKYGFKRDDGSPDIEKVFEEHAKPGTHYNPETWVHPAEAVINADVEREWAQREPRPQMFVHHAEQAPAPQRRSIEEMIKALAPVAQIARVFRLSEQDVLEMADLMGVDLTTPRDVKPVTEAGMQQEMIAQQEGRAAAGAKARTKSKPVPATATEPAGE